MSEGRAWSRSCSSCSFFVVAVRGGSGLRRPRRREPRARRSPGCRSRSWPAPAEQAALVGGVVLFLFATSNAIVRLVLTAVGTKFSPAEQRLRAAVSSDRSSGC